MIIVFQRECWHWRIPKEYCDWLYEHWFWCVCTAALHAITFTSRKEIYLRCGLLQHEILNSGSINHPWKAHLSHSGDHCNIYLLMSGFYWVFITDPEFRQLWSDYQWILWWWIVYLHLAETGAPVQSLDITTTNQKEKDKASIIAKEEQRCQSGGNCHCHHHTCIGLLYPCIDVEVMGPGPERRTGFHSCEGKGFAREWSLQLRPKTTPFPPFL